MKVSTLYYYPLKSCRGTALSSGVVDRRGFKDDRMMMFVDASGTFLSQREQPRLALVTPRLDGDTLTLQAPGMPPLAVARNKVGQRIRVSVWSYHGYAFDVGKDAATWISDYLAIPCKLVSIADDFTRLVNPKYSPRPGAQVNFADAYPFLLISEGSLEDLNDRLAEPVEMNRFRPNIVVSGCAPYAEDTWKRLRIGEVVFDVVKPCARCAITTTDQYTAVRGTEPLKTLATYRNVRGKVMFGQNLVHANEGVISIGDPVEILEENRNLPSQRRSQPG